MATSPTSGPGGGGGSDTTAFESGYYSGDEVTIANGGNALLPWSSNAGGDDVLDITDPTKPTVRKAGLFTFCIEAFPSGTVSPGGSFNLSLTLDFNGEAIEIRNTGYEGLCEIVGSWVLAVGEEIRLRAQNFDGALAQDFSINNATASRVGPA